MKKIIPGFLVSLLLVYFSFRGVDFHRVAGGLADIGGGYVLLFLALMLFMQALRSWRWGVILRPLAHVEPLPLFAITSIGFFAISVLPARLGEIVRPYLVARKGTVTISAALGTVFVERFLDGITILALGSLAPFFMKLPDWFIRANYIFLAFNSLLLSIVFCAVFRRSLLESLIRNVIRFLPLSWREPLDKFLVNFLDGFQIVGDGVRFLTTLLLSFFIWSIDALAIYLLFQAFQFSLPPAAALVLMVILIIGIAIPTAPGFIGNWHYACVLGLSIYAIPKTEALTFAVIYHFMSVGLTIVLGLAFLPYLKLSFADLRRAVRKSG